jgi:hypothetical protein
VKTAIGSLTLALALVASAASAAAEGPRVVPPKDFDHPYRAPGKVIVVPARDQDHVRELCPKAVFPGAALGCAKLTSTWDCQIVLADDSVIKAAGFPPELVRRHEIAHCNGWHADHRGALPFEEWAADTPIKTAAAEFDKFASVAVGKTVAEIAKAFENMPFSPGPRFALVAKGFGLSPESLLTSPILSNPAIAGPLARALGIGINLSENEWVQAHADAFYAAKARQAENATIAGARQPNPGQAAPQPTAGRATTDVVCAVVLNTPDGFLAVRGRPGTQFRMTDKLRPSQAVNISSEDCVWHSNGNVTCNKWIWVAGSDRTPASGWVRSRYLQPYPDC